MDNQTPQYRKEELTLGEVIQYGGAYLKSIKKYFVHILVFTILCTALSFFYYSSKPSLYKARLSFMLDEDEGSSLSGMNTILGQLGFPIMNQRINISKVLELSLSRKIIQEAIFIKIQTPNGSGFLANHIISTYSLDKNWTNEEMDMAGFRFSHSEVDSFTAAENKALRNIAVMISGTPANRKNALIQTDYGQNTTIMSYVTHSEDEIISYHLTKAVFDATSSFYVEKALEKQKSTFVVLSSKKDSLLKEYNRLEYRYADLSDRSTGIFSKKLDIKKDRARAEMLRLGNGLSKLEENIALVEFGIENSTPVLQIIDAPIFPLEEVHISKIKSLLIGGLIGLIISIGSVLFVALIQLIRKPN
ncbi:MAG: hypothetical protein V3V00_00665 [Saprospiraceae bacterium]